MKFNPVGWFEIYVEDLERATKFYEAMLDIKLEPLNSPVPEIQMMAFPMSMDCGGASGALAKVDGSSPGGNSVMVYFSCQNCAVEESRVKLAGGQVHRSKMSIGQYGFISLAMDSEGNMIGLHSRE
jgi:predicted enzyme related to lactoylglutathione lyase